jgi:negative regulator of replication initiation
MVSVCTVLAQRHGSAFATVATTLHGRKRQYIRSGPEELISPVSIPGTTLWVETNQSARSTVQLIEKLLLALGHEPQDFGVLYPQACSTGGQAPLTHP